LDQWLDDLARIIEIDPDDWVLETSIGTGQQCKNLYDHGGNGRFFGNDISRGMITECRRNIRTWDFDIGLVQGNAEALPLQNSIFDVVFHVGAFNFFTDKRAALSEMVRVAKPGANIHISDVSTNFLDLSPTVTRFLPGRIRNVTRVPIDLIPPNTRNISVQMLWNDLMWVLSFQKQP
jgi:ubiquinone/menaquinone biosynthesis C-methylase UbiE